MLKNKYFINVALVVIFCFSALNTSFANASDEINNIVITGNKRIEVQTIKSYLEFSKGQDFSEFDLNKAIKRLYATGLFADISIDRRANELLVNIVENPIINQIVFEGNKRIKDDKLEQEIALEPRSVYTKTKISQDLKRILNLYRKSGRFAVEVTPKIIQLAQNRVDLIFEIQEGKKATIKKINFVGNEFYSSDRLRKVINSSENKWYSFYSGNDTYDPDRVNFDSEVLRKFYTSNGFADFEVKSTVAEITKNKQSFIITFVLDEGVKYHFNEININSSLQDADNDQLREVLAIKKGELFDAGAIEGSIDELTKKLNDFGYAFVDINTSLKHQPKKKLIDINFNISEGPKVYIQRIIISGNVRTLDKVIRREFRIAEGDPYNAAKIRRSQQRIRNLGFFEKVEITSKPSADPDKADLIVEVAERSTGELNFGVGFSTTDGALGNVSVRERNLLGKGQDLRVSFQRSARGGQLDLGFTEPYFLGRDLSAGFDLFNNSFDQQDESSFESQTKGGRLRAGYSVTEHLRHNLFYSLRDIEISNVDDNASTFIKRQEGRNLASIIGHSLVYDKRDIAFNPTSGYLLSLSQSVAGLGGDSQFIKNELRADYHQRLYKKYVILTLATRAGHIFGYGDNDIRINERFFIGENTIRGFDVAGIGPRDRMTGDALGGNNYYAVTAEVMFPLGLPEELGVRGALFVDAGSLFDSDDEGADVLDQSSLRLSVGVGFAWDSPFGPIRIDFSNAILKEDFDETETIRFNFGTRF